MPYPKMRITKISLVLVLAGALMLPEGAASVATAAGSGCRNPAIQNRELAIGSQVDGDLVTICLSKSQLQKLKQTAAPKPKVSTRPAPNLPQVKKPAAKKPPAKPTVRTKVRSRKSKGNGVFKPRVVQPTVTPVQLSPNQSAKFESHQVVRTGFATIAGSRVQVKFTPISQDVDFGDGSKSVKRSRNCSIPHIYRSAGTYTLMLRVTFRVNFRLVGGQIWFVDPDTVTLPASPLQVRVGRAGGRVVLLNPDAPRL